MAAIEGGRKGKTKCKKTDMVIAYSTDLLQVSLHNLRTVVDSQNDIGNTSLGKGLNLVLDHGLVGKLDEGFGQGQGL